MCRTDAMAYAALEVDTGGNAAIEETSTSSDTSLIYPSIESDRINVASSPNVWLCTFALACGTCKVAKNWIFEDEETAMMSPSSWSGTTFS